MEKAINILIRGYKVFLYQLDRADSAKAEGLAKMKRDGNPVVHMMSLKVIHSLPQLGLLLNAILDIICFQIIQNL